MESEKQQEHMLERRITRRSAIKAGGIAAVGLAFSKPIIETIHPPTAFAQSSPPPAVRGACHFDGSSEHICFDGFTESQCVAEGGLFGGDGSTCEVEE